jgi:hypothetical protein
MADENGAHGRWAERGDALQRWQAVWDLVPDFLKRRVTEGISSVAVLAAGWLIAKSSGLSGRDKFTYAFGLFAIVVVVWEVVRALRPTTTSESELPVDSVADPIEDAAARRHLVKVYADLFAATCLAGNVGDFIRKELETRNDDAAPILLRLFTKDTIHTPYYRSSESYGVIVNEAARTVPTVQLVDKLLEVAREYQRLRPTLITFADYMSSVKTWPTYAKWAGADHRVQELLSNVSYMKVLPKPTQK